MDMRFLHFLFLTFVGALVILEINAQTTHDTEGKICVTSDGGGGVCLQLPQCPQVVNAITHGIRNHTRCGFIDAIELVCCVLEPFNAITTNHSLKLHTSTQFPPTTHFTESSTRSSNWLPFYAKESAVSTVRPTTTTLVDSTSTTVKSQENYVEGGENDVEGVNLDINKITDDVEDRIFLGNKHKNKFSPTRFAFNTLSGFVNAILGKPPPPRPSPTRLPPLLRPVTKPPTQIYTTPLHYSDNERATTRKPETYYPLTNLLQPPIMYNPILNFKPNAILTYKPKPSQAPVTESIPTSAWTHTYSTYSPGFNNVRPEYPYISKPSPLPVLSTEKPSISVHLPLTGKPNTHETTVTSVLSQPVYSSSEYTVVENFLTSSPETSRENKFSTLIPDLEPTTTEISVTSDAQTVPPEVLVIPDVPFVTPTSPEDPGLGLDGERSTPYPLGSEPFSGTPLLGTKSQQACARYREIPKLTRYIVGGDFAAHGEFPHMVALGFQRPRQSQLTWMCGGTLLNEEYVLTAAHCVVTRFGRPVAARVGYTNLTADASTGLELALRDAVVHPGYNAATRAHDIALLRLAAPVSYSQFVHPACLHAAHAPPPGWLLVTGWGSITPDGSSPTDHLKRASVTPVDDSSCRQIYPRIFRSEMICASGDDVDTCKGDSGGPMQYLADSNSTIYSVVGVTSFGPNPCATGRPGVYSRVASYLPWIEGVAWPN